MSQKSLHTPFTCAPLQAAAVGPAGRELWPTWLHSTSAFACDHAWGCKTVGWCCQGHGHLRMPRTYKGVWRWGGRLPTSAGFRAFGTAFLSVRTALKVAPLVGSYRLLFVA